ncbi:unnamed protein product [Phytophthora fragariaefolia]|uniref:Unnamed protein product n=1 Tax=Phytophthora fragariaefolia TaxID=1490495 RepID=A0A9W6X5G5_9STRA|nr:unnamed protein product [Phytophthora fragariaefolia]
MAKGQNPLARAQAHALRALSADAPSPAASDSVMAPPSDALETDGGSLLVAGPTEASVPGIPSAAPVGGANGGVSESSSASAGTDLSSTLGAVPRLTADAPEDAPGVSLSDSQPQG